MVVGVVEVVVDVTVEALLVAVVALLVTVVGTVVAVAAIVVGVADVVEVAGVVAIFVKVILLRAVDLNVVLDLDFRLLSRVVGSVAAVDL